MLLYTIFLALDKKIEGLAILFFLTKKKQKEVKFTTEPQDFFLLFY